MKLIADLLKQWVARAIKSKTRVITRAWGRLVQRTSGSMLALVLCAITRRNLLHSSILRDVRREVHRLADAGRTMRAIVDLLPPNALKKSDFHYDLPAELIAQAPGRTLRQPPAAGTAGTCRLHRPAGA